MPIKPFRLFVIDDVDFNRVIANYKSICQEGVRDLDDTSLTMEGPVELKYITGKEPRQPLKDDARILCKLKYLVHSIAYRFQTNQEDQAQGVSMQMSVLQDVIGEDAFPLIQALIESGYVTRSSIYEVGKYARRYKVIGGIHTEPCTNARIQGYIQKTKDLLAAAVTKRLSSHEFKDEYGEGFADTYVKNLSKFKIEDRKGFNAYAAKQIRLNPSAEPYYEYIKASFQDKLRIYAIDANNRIYHILTSLKRELKPYINIRYSIDCSNSHPLLFNYFIFISKNTSLRTAYEISQALSKHKDIIILSKDHSKPTSNAYFVSNDAGSDAIVDKTHYDTGKLRNVLIESGIRKTEIDKYADDELLYIWKTTGGFFWDDVLRAHPDDELTRPEIKQKMFGEVFYSKTTEDVWKRFGQEFKAQFPNVYDLILRWKAPLSSPDTKAVLLRRNKAVELGNRAWMKDETTALPNVMMDLESVIFRDILQALFRKRVCAVHIHDAIVVPAVKSTEHLEPEQVCEVMRQAYKRFGLCPSLKVESY